MDESTVRAVNESYWFTDDEILESKHIRLDLETELQPDGKLGFKVKVTHDAGIYYCPYIPVVMMKPEVEQCKVGKNPWWKALLTWVRGLLSRT